MMRFASAFCWMLFLTSLALADVSFPREILPILSDNCFHCHGPDPNTREAGLRLDTKEGAFRVRKGKAVIVPGKSSESLLIERICSEDATEKMPPPESNRKLTAKQIDLLTKWIDEGAKWEQHWSFIPPQSVPVPKVKQTDWPRQSLDAFILARLEKEGMKPSLEANKETWLRRVTLDLTGFPPTLAEIDSFQKDASPDAYEKVVDRLLKSPRYGERLATEWLDLARYADTHGYQMDRHRPMWPYRDWVIQAFNKNLPFDQFITWQLAGDLLPKPTKEQRLATAFNRLHMQNEEGGVIEEEFRVAYVADRVTTFGTAFLGLTFECCRCHDHKYDPLSQKDFYSLFAFFQNIDEAGQTTYFTNAMPVPTLLLSTEEQDAKLAELDTKMQAKEKQIQELRQQAQKDWLELRNQGPLPFKRTNPIAHFTFDEIKNNQIANSIDTQAPAKGHDGPQLCAGKFGKAVELSGENGFVFPKIGHFSRVDPFSISLWINPASHAPRQVILHHSKAPVDAGSRGYELLLEKGKVAVGLHHMWPGNSLKVVTKQVVPVQTWSHVACTYDGSSRAKGLQIYIDGQLQEVEILRDGLWKDITYEGGEPDLAIGYRFRDNGFKGGKIDELKLFDRTITQIDVFDLAQSKANISEQQQLDHYLATEHTALIKANQELRDLRKQQSNLINPIPEVMAMQELQEPKPAFVLKRGVYDAFGEQVTSDTPASLPAFSKDWPRNRLGLARWLTHPDHPLTARVTVNRLWQMMFGKGLVETSDNFGLQGTPPTHPELLDFLAKDFVANGWDVHTFLKKLALSATYRQSSKITAEALQKDPNNTLLGRAPVRRLSAEMLRDQALFVSGLYVEKQGGPSVYPYQPEGIWEEAMGRPHYPRSKGADLYRRSLYTYWKRTAPHPAMITFDAADRSVCSAKRQATSTPLQALALLNDTQIVEAARFLAQRLLQEGGTTLDAQIRWTFQTVVNRKPTDQEITILQTIYQEQQELFNKDSKEAAKLLSIGDSKADPKFKQPDLAAATVLSLAILNHDEAVNRR